jgi:hypothetical protein
MPTISGVTMSIASGSSTTARNVTVSGTLAFDASDVGRTYHLGISLFGEDRSGDHLPVGDPMGDDEIFAYKWGFLLTQKPYKVIAVSAAGAVPFTETRAVTNAKLDEDPGDTSNAAEADIHTPLPGMPLRDELYARATLTAAPVSARSATITSGFGV